MKNLKTSQIQRIDRLALVRYRKARHERKRSLAPLWLFLAGILWLIMFAVGMMERHWNPGGDLFTSLPHDLDLQRPSITILAGDK